jgi:hypothetical protein
LSRGYLDEEDTDSTLLRRVLLQLFYEFVLFLFLGKFFGFIFLNMFFLVVSDNFFDFELDLKG